MTKHKILFIFGTRPEAIKVAPVYAAFAGHERFDAVTCSTGQHREMLAQVIDFFEMPTHHDLHVMKADQSLEWLTETILHRLGAVMEKEQPDFVFVQGDTTTTFIGALAAFYRKIPVGHIEAGLRTYNVHSPYPEEMNRQLTGRLTTLHFPPTPRAKENLLKENIPEDRIFITGNTAIDAILDAKLRLGAAPMPEHPYILITAHRRESFGDQIKQICLGIKQAADTFKDFRFIYPVHLNPNIRGPVHEILKGDNIELIDPQPYPEFVKMQLGAHFIVSDSGGIQEEAPSLGKPVVVIRENTERPEGVEAGTNIMAGTSREGIFKTIKMLIEDKEKYRNMARTRNPYGDGTAGKQILEITDRFFRGRRPQPLARQG